MPKAEKGTPKAIANAMKSKGLQRLRWYCQVCEKQCRDENGFTLLSRRWGTKRVLANMVYQEYIADKNHSHMNATQWVTLSEFVKQMGREGILHVDETEKGLHMAWIDSSPQALARQAAHQAKERSELDDEERMRKLIAEQIEKAQQEQAGRTGPSQSSTLVVPDQDRVLKRDQANGHLKLSFGTSIPATNPLKRASTNPLKSHSSKSSTSSMSKPNNQVKMSALESIIAEDEARKRRKDEQYISVDVPLSKDGGSVYRRHVEMIKPFLRFEYTNTFAQKQKNASKKVIGIDNRLSSRVAFLGPIRTYSHQVTRKRFNGSDRIYSHPQYPGIEEIPTSSTSEAASIVSQDTSLSSLAICSAACVDYYMDLNVLDFDIPDAGTEI
ncbi:hypothetical protein KEM48_002986 [Puccinia striiformis f. sp. tritici PST-130]|nr:hypothetical protein KEM48_002986 [Puccinia striiformis f. sp. tritici PST-130]